MDGVNLSREYLAIFAYPSPMMSIISNTSSGSSGEIESLRRSFFFLTFSSSDEDMVNYALESCWLWRNLRAKKKGDIENVEVLLLDLN